MVVDNGKNRRWSDWCCAEKSFTQSPTSEGGGGSENWQILDIDKVSREGSDLTHRVIDWVKTPIQVSHGC